MAEEPRIALDAQSADLRISDDAIVAALVAATAISLAPGIVEQADLAPLPAASLDEEFAPEVLA